MDSNIPLGKWIIDGLIAFGTVGAVIVALFVQPFGRKFFRPRLKLTCPKAFGSIIPVRVIPTTSGLTAQQPGLLGQQQPTSLQARYCQVTVSNLRRWSPATEVRVLLMQVEEPGPDGIPQITYAGELPIVWQHSQLFPLARTIGPDAIADLFSVVKNGALHLQTQIVPFNLQTRREASTASPLTLILTVQAFATEVASNALRIQVNWDGGWHDGEKEMGRYLTVRDVSAQKQT